MREIFIKQSIELLRGFDDANVKLASDKLNYILNNKTIMKQADNAFFSSPEFHNIINLLGPMATYWKISQAIKLLKEMGNEFGTRKSLSHPSF
jgi:hypothetical protein